MKKTFFSLITVVFFLLLHGCASDNAKNFIPDPLHKLAIEKTLNKRIMVNVTMPAGSRDSIACRLINDIYLPNKVSYSKYIEDAFKKVLISVNQLANKSSLNNTLQVALTKVDFSSVMGEWHIAADVKLGNKPTVKIASMTKFGTSWAAEYACKNSAEAFDGAVNNFISKVLTNKELLH